MIKNTRSIRTHWFLSLGVHGVFGQVSKESQDQVSASRALDRDTFHQKGRKIWGCLRVAMKTHGKLWKIIEIHGHNNYDIF